MSTAVQNSSSDGRPPLGKGAFMESDEHQSLPHVLSHPSTYSSRSALDLLRACAHAEGDADPNSDDHMGSDVPTLSLLSELLRNELRREGRTLEDSVASRDVPKSHDAADDISSREDFGGVSSAASDGITKGGSKSLSTSEMSTSSSMLQFMVHRCGETAEALPTLATLAQLLSDPSPTEMVKATPRVATVAPTAVPVLVWDNETAVVPILVSNITSPTRCSAMGATCVSGRSNTEEVKARGHGVNPVQYSSALPSTCVRPASAKVTFHDVTSTVVTDPVEPIARRPSSAVESTLSGARKVYAQRYLQRLYFRSPVVVKPSSQDISSLHRRDTHMRTTSGRLTQQKGAVSRQKEFTDLVRSHRDPSQLPPRPDAFGLGVRSRSPSCRSTESRENPEFMRCHRNLHRAGEAKVHPKKITPSRCSSSQSVASKKENPDSIRCYRDPTSLLYQHPESRTQTGWQRRQRKQQEEYSQQLFHHYCNHNQNPNQQKQQHQQRNQQCGEPSPQRVENQRSPVKNGVGSHASNTSGRSPSRASHVTPGRSLHHVEMIRVRHANRMRALLAPHDTPPSPEAILDLMIEGTAIPLPSRCPPTRVVKNLRRNRSKRRC